jgi:hypothetical protein
MSTRTYAAHRDCYGRWLNHFDRVHPTLSELSRYQSGKFGHVGRARVGWWFRA